MEKVELALSRVHLKVGHDVAKTETAVGRRFRVEAHVQLGAGFYCGAHY